MNYLKYTPIFINLDNYSDLEPIEEDPIIPELEEGALEYPQDYIFPYRYYLEIVPPANNQSGFTPKRLPFISINRTGLLNNCIRLNLKPSIGYGINSCYKINFWAWQPVVSKIVGTKPRQLTKEIIKTEYWHIPKIDNKTYIVEPPELEISQYKSRFFSFKYFDYPYNNRTILSSRQIKVYRRYDTPGGESNIIIDEIIDRKDLDIFTFPNNLNVTVLEEKVQDSKYPNDESIERVSLKWLKDIPESTRLPNKSSNAYRSLYLGETYNSSTNTIEGVKTELIYTIHYLKPLTIEDINHHDSYSTSRNNSIISW